MEAASDSKDVGSIEEGSVGGGRGGEPTACNWDRGSGCPGPTPVAGGKREVLGATPLQPSSVSLRRHPGKEEFVATFKGNEFFCSTCPQPDPEQHGRDYAGLPHPAAQWADAAHGQVGRLRPTCPSNPGQSGSSSTWAREPLKPLVEPVQRQVQRQRLAAMSGSLETCAQVGSRKKARARGV